jgi:hypothetical protein
MHSQLQDIWSRIPVTPQQHVQPIVKRENFCWAWCSWMFGLIMKIDWMGKRERQDVGKRERQENLV